MFNIQSIFQSKEAEGITLTTDDKWNLIRLYRDDLLAKSDWTQLPDSLTEEQKVPWTVYRQSLRDLPGNYTNPDEVIFPDIPTGV